MHCDSFETKHALGEHWNHNVDFNVTLQKICTLSTQKRKK